MRQLEEGWYECFDWPVMAMRMNVSKALDMVGAPYAAPDARLLIASLARSKSIAIVHECHHANLREPVLIATIANAHLLVDGRHRVKKALFAGRVTLPCYVLTERETELCFEGKQRSKWRKLREFLKHVEPKVDLIHAS